MKATKLLVSQHKEVSALFHRLEKAEDKDEKFAIFEELAGNLAAHDDIEREIFYPACEQAMGMTELLGESLVEHGVIEFSLYLADQARGGDDFDHKVKVLKEMIEHHVEEEQDELFPKVEKALGEAKLEELGAAMEAHFEEAKEADFRGPLVENLRQVIAGATETIPAKGAKKKSAAKKAPAKARTSASSRTSKRSDHRATH